MEKAEPHNIMGDHIIPTQGGITGNLSYSGKMAEFLPLMKYCEKVRIGKQTTFGLGKIEIA
jgi:CRISPR/Cas system endoribonuclease Cas6 (RAMP superfamily)